MLDLTQQDRTTEGDTRICQFFSEMNKASARILVLGYEGVVAPFRTNNLVADPDPQIHSLLRDVRDRTDTRLVIVSNNRIRDMPRLHDVGDVEIWGCRGLEHLMPNGNYERTNVDEDIARSIAEVGELMISEGLGVLAKPIPYGIAIYWQKRDMIASEITRRVLRVWSMLSSQRGLRLVPFGGGIEIRVNSTSKGSVVQAILSEISGVSAVAYLGGDFSDEEAFEALHNRGLSILVRDQHGPTLADAWIRAPEGVAAFLGNWISACKRGS